ncbi:MAG: hypothetical protein AAGA85_04340 [Bacteroidota bacterium]
MRYYLIKSKVLSDVWDTIITEYDALSAIGEELIHLEGGTLISQYVGATEPVTYSTITFSGSPARLLYKLLSIGIYSEVEMTELVSQPDFEKVVDKISATSSTI